MTLTRARAVLSRLWPGPRAATWALVVVGAVLVVGTGMGPIADGGVASADRNGSIDDFEDGNMSEWILTAGTSSGTQSQTVYEGSEAAVVKESGGSAVWASEKGLDRYPVAGDTFEARVYIRDAGKSEQAFLIFGANDTTGSGFYRLKMDAPGTSSAELELEKSKDGTGTTLDEDTTVGAPEGTWFRVRVAWGINGQITATVYDGAGAEITTLQATDEMSEGGGIRMQVYNSEAYFDALEITSSETTHGRVTDGDGNPLPEATVEAVNTSTGNVVERANTTVAGEYALSLSDGTYDIRASKSGYPDKNKTVDVPSERSGVDLQLAESGSSESSESVETEGGGGGGGSSGGSHPDWLTQTFVGIPAWTFAAAGLLILVLVGRGS